MKSADEPVSLTRSAHTVNTTPVPFLGGRTALSGRASELVVHAPIRPKSQVEKDSEGAGTRRQFRRIPRHGRLVFGPRHVTNRARHRTHRHRAIFGCLVSPKVATSASAGLSLAL